MPSRLSVFLHHHNRGNGTIPICDENHRVTSQRVRKKRLYRKWSRQWGTIGTVHQLCMYRACRRRHETHQNCPSPLLSSSLLPSFSCCFKIPLASRCVISVRRVPSRHASKYSLISSVTLGYRTTSRIRCNQLKACDKESYRRRTTNEGQMSPFNSSHVVSWGTSC